MKSGKRIAVAAALAICGAVAMRGELEPWVQHTAAGAAISALFRMAPMPGGAVPIRRPPAETRPALEKLAAAAPRDAMLLRLRAREAELAEDFAAAEAGWKRYAQAAPDAYAGYTELADFYHREVRPRDELAALAEAVRVKDDGRARQAFERMAAEIQTDGLAESVAEPVFRAWVARFPGERDPRRRLIGRLIAHRQFAAAEAEIAKFGSAFHDELETVRWRAALAQSRDSADAAIRVYDAALQPLWPDEMSAAYFDLLRQQERLREFAGRARAALAANRADLNAAARLFHYFHAQQNAAAARRVLLEYRLAKESGKQPWTADELLTAAQLFERCPDVPEAARLYYRLYSTGQSERGLAGLANLLLTAPAQPIEFGAADLSLYKDIATVDPSPGFLNGILSLVLNSTALRWQYEAQNEKSAAYFHRAAAARLVNELDRRFPKSVSRAPLHAALVSAYGAYGDDDAVIRAGRAYLAAFPGGSARVAVAMQVSDALARRELAGEEFALYDQMLRELGSGSPAYGQVLDKYLSRLAAVGRPLEALRVYRIEIDRNPNDARLYARLAAYVEQNAMGREVEEVYSRAMAQFADRSWYHRLARWYLRNHETAELEKLSRQVIAVFSGSELEKYFAEIVSQAHPDAALYRQLNLYAHERFPEDLIFVRNLIGAYSRPETYDRAAAERLLRQYWFYDPELRTRLLQQLWRQGQLYGELAQVQTADNPAALQFVTEAEGWLSHFEAAAPVARTLAEAYPGRREFTSRAAALHRSLAAYDARQTEAAAAMAEREQRSAKRETGALAKIGDIYAEQERFGRARAFWDRMPAAQPGKAEAYLDAATVYWDYYHYDDALRLIAAARAKFRDPALFAYQAGAIHENQRDYRGAVREYLAGALAGDGSAHHRLMTLAGRKQTRTLVDQATGAAVSGSASSTAATLRMAVLEHWQRREDLEKLLAARVEAETSAPALAGLQETARRLGFEAIELRASRRAIEVSNDPVDKLRLTLAAGRLREAKKDIAGAGAIIDGLYRDHPLVLGVVRGAVDFHVRNHQYDAAIEMLLASAKRANAELADQFTLEAARMATAAGEFDRARTLVGGLLAADPLRAEYLAAMADTYLRANDDRGFRDYQLTVIRQLKQPERIASIRRALIPAMTRMGDYAGAVEQYMLTINSYPEDEGLTREAAAYAMAHGEAGRMLAFYRKTIHEAPRDYRWPIVLGRIETVTEDFPAAIADYERAMQARPDRADVLEAKARLQERLMRFGDALGSYTRLYELTYRDPQWLMKAAELQARMGHRAEAVSALQSAILGARKETAKADFAIAQRLEAWHMLPDAVSFAERGAALEAGLDATYVRLMALTRRLNEVLARFDPKTDVALMEEAGGIVARDYTPEEKSRLAEAMSGKPELLALAASAGLPDLEARWRLEAMESQSRVVDQQFTMLQSRRGLYATLGRQLEHFAAENSGRQVEGNALVQAIQAYIAEGDVESQMRVMAKGTERHALWGVLLDRYLALLAARQPEELLRIARSDTSVDVRNRAVQIAIGSDKPALAYAAVQGRGASLPVVWTRAFTALAGVYFDDHAPAIGAAFADALDTRTIGERLRSPVKRDAAMVGPVWFYYGARYGEYLAAAKSSEAAAWLPASVEAAPGNADAYMALGRYEAALQLDPDRGDAYDRIACALWDQGRRAEAAAEWRKAIAAFVRVESRGVRVPDSFWRQAAQTFADLGERHALGEVRGEIAQLIGDYYQRNHQYRLHELIEPAARASLKSGEGMEWLLELGRSMANPETMLNTLMSLAELTPAQRIALQRDQIALLEKQVQGGFGDNRFYLTARVRAARAQLVTMLLDAGDAKSAAEFALVGEGYAALEIRVAAKTGALDRLIERYAAAPEKSPDARILREAALELREEHDEQGARALLEFTYEREIHDGHLDAANFLGLAEVKLQRGDEATAVRLLNRMSLVEQDGFETLLPAAELLGRYGRKTAAAEFLRRRVKAVPWDARARLQLGDYASVMDDSQADYRLRADAARMAGRSFAADVMKPYHVEARIDAARQSRDPEMRLRLWRQALAIAPGDERARLGALEAAISARHDSLALALAPMELKQLPAEKRAPIAEALAGAAERLDDLKAAESYLQMAVDASAAGRRAAPTRKRDALAAELDRRMKNAARQPVIKNIIEQDQVVRPRVGGTE